jgi:tetratricopeptide (TPR) repeat protein
MASKVNVRFVVILSVVLGVIVVGMATMGILVLTHSGAELEGMGDQAMAEKDFKNAIVYYGKSFSDDQTHIGRLDKYIGAMRAFTPDNQALYSDYYRNKFLPALMFRANLLKGDVTAQTEILDVLSRNMYEGGFYRRGWDNVAEVATTAIAGFESGAQSPGWERLKRYRGLAYLEIFSAGQDLEEPQLALIESDLRAALAADPADEKAALGLVTWHTLTANLAAKEEDESVEAEHRAKALEALDTALAAHPDSVQAAATAIGLKVEAAARAANPKQFTPDQRLKMMRDAAAALEPELAALFARVRAGLEQADASILYRLNRLERFIRNNKDDESQALIDQSIGLKPAAADLRYLRGRISEERAQHQQAIDQYQALLAIPIPPLSLEGVLLYEQRLAAITRQAEAAMALWEKATAEEKADALKKVDHYREQLELAVPPSSPDLLLLKAKIAYASGKLPDAKRMLDDHISQTGSTNPDSIRLGGLVAMQMNQPGIARDRFKRLVELTPDSPSAKLLLGDIEGKLENHEAALLAYDEALLLDPENAYANEKVSQLKQLLGRATISDPIVKALDDANRAWTGRGVIPDRDAAVAILEQCVAANPADIRPIQMLLTFYVQLDKVDQAKALCQRGLELAPDNDTFKKFKLVLDAPDPYTAGLQLIDLAGVSESDKLMAKHGLALRNNRPEEATRFLAEAINLAPNDPGVIELRFAEAITADRLDAAAALVDQATRDNLDRVGGATFRARLLLAESKKAEATDPTRARTKKAEAIDTVRAATQTGMATPGIWRFLGQIQSDAGHPEDALASFNEALRMNPSDIGAIIDTLKTFIRLQRYDEGLNLARTSEAYGRTSIEFKDLWLRLEASVGNKAFVILQREAILKSQPGNDANKLALVQTYLTVGEWAKSRPLIDDLRKKQDSLLLVQLDAKWHADQGDREGARTLYLDYISAQKAANAAVTPEPYVAMAEFLVGIGDVESGMAALSEARNYQDPKRLDVDRTLGMMLFDLNRLEEALPVLEGYLAAGVPDQYPEPWAVRARQVEALVRLGRFADAEKAIDQAGTEAAQSVTLMLLRASARQGLKDDQGALAIINDAVTRYPSEALGYVKRAEMTSNSAESLSDAIADLDTAIRLRPSLIVALQLRALLKLRQNRNDEAMDDLARVVALKPELPGPRNALLQTLIETGKFEEAVSRAIQIANQRPRDLPLQMSLAELFVNYANSVPNALQTALNFYARGWQMGPRADVAIVYTRALLKSRRPEDLQLTEQILAFPEIQTDQNPQLLMNRAILLSRQGATDRSRLEAAKALKLVISSPGDTSIMLDQLDGVFGDPGNNTADLAALIDFVQSVDMNGLPDLWPDFFRARFRFKSPPLRKDALDSLRRVVAGAKDPALQRVSGQFLSAALIGSGDQTTDPAAARTLYEESLQVIEGLLALDANNAEALNNAAYVLTENLKRPADALPLAERAVAASPDVGPFLDTLGLIYLELGRLDDAENALNRAARAGGSIDQRLQLGLKLIRLKVLKKDIPAAQSIMDEANTATRNSAPLKERYQAQLDLLQKDIDNLR